MYLGLDLGTSGVKALLVDDDGYAVGSADATYDVSHPAPGWSEQDPGDWVRGVGAALAALRNAHPQAYGAIRALSFSGHMHGAVMVDAAGSVLRPCILWNDTRSHIEAAAMDADPVARVVSGNVVFPGFTAPKLAWVAQNEPDIFARVARVMLPKDYLLWWLTGRYATEMSDAAGTAWLDVGARAWSDDLLALGGMSRDQMPDLLEGTDVVGEVQTARADLALPPTCKVVAGGADNAVAACGVGALGDGDGFVSLGTSGVVLAGRDRYAPDADTAVHTFCHAVPGRWYQMGVVLAATDSLNWLSRITGQSAADLSAALGDTLTPPGPVRFYPYLSGERTPHNDAQVRGGFTHLDIASGPQDLTRAVMTGVSFALRDSFEALKATGANLPSALAIGGGSRSDHWTRMLATTLNIPLERPDEGAFGAALGAARIAMCGDTGADPASVMTKPPIADVIHPDAALVSAYDDAYSAFAGAYPKLKAMP
ncbi:xylulokinase [Tateyamaria omphalii]|uniref:Xylulose kinase n=1 Tax=Tateyamaria omphalii TaxID=299262 RepID=A0A1P8MQJ2_9RHOB|nr:xylulokinase [Tateyamaria omphalii]APX10346.1 xylulokinase [Tateyamaria omphalii]